MATQTRFRMEDFSAETRAFLERATEDVDIIVHDGARRVRISRVPLPTPGRDAEETSPLRKPYTSESPAE
jgi:hypothetical protein